MFGLFASYAYLCIGKKMSRMRKMIVGLAESADPENVVVMRSYVDAVRRGGHLPLVLPATLDEEEAGLQLERIDLLLLLGGGDIAAERFGCKPMATDGVANALRDGHELLLFRLACACGKPVVGICRGMQIVNVGLGGDLYQDLPMQLTGSQVNHSRPDSKWAPVHGITIEPDSRLASVLGVERTEVNSTHHQAVRRLGEGLKAVAYSEDGVVEAIEHATLPVAAVQFHPERLAWGSDVLFTRLFVRLKDFASMER